MKITRKKIVRMIIWLLSLIFMIGVLMPLNADAAESLDGAKQGVVQVNLIYKDDENVTHIIDGGAGFLIGDEEENVEYVITCKHTIEPGRDYIKKALKNFGVKKDEIDNKVDAVEYEVVVANDVCTSASLYLESDNLDLAVLQLSEKLSNRTMFSLLTSDDGSIGDLPYASTDTVYSLGFPAAVNYEENPAYYNSDQVVMLSGRIMNMHYVNDTYVITHDIAVGANNCGGPLLNEDGYVIGMNVLSMDGDYYVAVDATEMIDIFDSFGMKYGKLTAKDIKPVEEPAPRPVVPEQKVIEKQTIPTFIIIIGIVFAVILVVLIVVVALMLIKQKKADGTIKPKKNKKADKEIKKPFSNDISSMSSKSTGIVNGADTSVLNSQKNDETSVLDTSDNLGGTICRGKLIRKKTGDNIEITKERTVIGKDSLHTDYCIRDNSAISRMHTVIVANSKGVYIEDAQSTNGTFVNGKRLEDGQQVELRGGENIKLGNEEFIFRK